MKKVYLYNSHFTQFTLEILDNLNMKTTWKQSQRKQIGQVPLHRRASILNQDQTVSVTVSFKNHILSTSNPPYPFYLYFLIVLFKFNEKKKFVLRIMAVTAIENVNIPLSGTSTPV